MTAGVERTRDRRATGGSVTVAAALTNNFPAGSSIVTTAAVDNLYADSFDEDRGCCRTDYPKSITTFDVAVTADDVSRVGSFVCMVFLWLQLL